MWFDQHTGNGSTVKYTIVVSPIHQFVAAYAQRVVIVVVSDTCTQCHAAGATTCRSTYMHQLYEKPEKRL